MALEYKKDFDTILTEILTDYSNLDSNPDVSRGSMPYIQGSVLASMVWGLYRYNDYNAKQMFVDTADSDNLKKHGAILDIPYLDTDTDSTYLTKILNFLRQAPAGGNKLDFETWAKDSENCYYDDGGTIYYNEYATIVEGAFGAGTVGVYTIPNDEMIIDVTTPVNVEEGLRLATENYIESVRPLGMAGTFAVSAKPVSQNVTITIVQPDSGDVDTDEIKTAIEDTLNAMVPCETLYMSTLICIALSYGAKNATLTTPSADVAVDNDDFIRSGTVTVND